MDVLHDAFLHKEDNYKCMTSGEEILKSKPRLTAEDMPIYLKLVEKLCSSPQCKYQSGKHKGTQFIEKINYKLEAPSNKK